MKKSLNTLLVVLTLVQTILACGMLTHIEISQRAFHHFTPSSQVGNDYKAIVRKFPEFFTAGSPFPDWGYMCDYHDAGEAAHWPPFIHAYIEYMNTNYNITDDRYQQMVAFLLGVESHGEADVIWHWGKQVNGTDESGYLRAMSHAASDCADSFDACHGVGDTGADMYLAYRGNLSWMAQAWSLPVHDLRNIYNITGMDVPEDKLWACPEIMYAGSIFERLGGEVDLFDNEKHSAFLTEELDLYHSGGLDDMGINVEWQWNNTIKMIENRTNTTSRKKISRRKNPLRLFTKKYWEASKEEREKIRELIGLKMTNSSGVLKLEHNQERVKENKEQLLQLLRDYLGIRQNITIDKHIPKIDPHDSNVSVTTFGSDQKYSYFGKAIATGDFNGDGIEDIVVGAPGYGIKQLGAIYITSNLSSLNYSEPHMVGKDIFGRFGYHVAVLDINRDGYDDLIVSSPTASLNNGPSPQIEDYYPKDYNGKLTVYFGSKNGIAKAQDPNITILSKDKSDVFFNLGYHLSVGDCNNDGMMDLIVGSPYSQQGGDNKGHVSIFLGLNSTKSEIYIEDADFTLSGENDYQLFGKSVACGNGVVVVGAAGHRYNNQTKQRNLKYVKSKSSDGLPQSSGAVYGFDLISKKRMFKIECDVPQAKFGHSIALNNYLLAVGASSMSNFNSQFSHYHGAVFLYDIRNITAVSASHYSKFNAAIRSWDHRSRFGHRVAFSGNNLIVTAPQYSYPPHIEEGRLVYFLDAHLMKGEVDIESAKANAFAHNSGARFGDHIHVSSKRIYVSSPYASHIDYNAGQISYIDKDSL